MRNLTQKWNVISPPISSTIQVGYCTIPFLALVSWKFPFYRCIDQIIIKVEGKIKIAKLWLNCVLMCSDMCGTMWHNCSFIYRRTRIDFPFTFVESSARMMGLLSSLPCDFYLTEFDAQNRSFGQPNTSAQIENDDNEMKWTKWNRTACTVQ